MTTTVSEQSDQQLLKAFQRNRDSEAFATIVERHHGLIFGVARRMLGCRHAAEDVVQATFLVLAKDAAKVRNRTALASWLYGIAYRISARIVQQRSRVRVAPLVDEIMIEADPLAKLSEQFEQNTVFDELHQLPNTVRAPMVLRYLQGKSNAEVADELSLSESAVEGRLKRGRTQLRMRLARQGVAFAVGVALLDSIKQEAIANPMPQFVADTVGACLHDAPGVGELVSQEAIHLAEEEVMKIFTAKVVSSVWVAAATVCVAVAGWGLVGNGKLFAQAEGALLAQADDPFGAGAGAKGEHVIAADNDPFGAAPAKNTNTFRTASAKQPPSGAGFGGPAKQKPSLADRMRNLGQYGIGNETEAEVRILEVLAQQFTQLEFQEEPLSNVMQVVAEMYEIPVVIDKRALEDEGIDPSGNTVTLAVKNIHLRNAMTLMLEQLDLAMVVRNEVLMITSQSVAEELLTTRVYKLRSHWDASERELLDTITSMVEPDSWAEVGGPGALKTVPGGIFVSNTLNVHEEISKLFTQLERLYEENSSDGDGFGEGF